MGEDTIEVASEDWSEEEVKNMKYLAKWVQESMDSEMSFPKYDDYFFVIPFVIGKISIREGIETKYNLPSLSIKTSGSCLIYRDKYKRFNLTPDLKIAVCTQLNLILKKALGYEVDDKIQILESQFTRLTFDKVKEEHLRIKASKKRDELQKEIQEKNREVDKVKIDSDRKISELSRKLEESEKEAQHFKELYSKSKED